MIHESDYQEYSIIGKYYTKKRSRLEGFYRLSNKTFLSNHLQKTKFCQIKIKFGKCNRQTCNFAHSSDELCKPICAFGENCNKKDMCQFLHITSPISV
jgi:hypothetical protein